MTLVPLFSLRLHFSQALQTYVSRAWRARLFPSTLGKPRTAFTFNLFKDIHVHGLSSKKSVYDYHDALRRLTDPVFPEQVPVRNSIFIFGNLANVKRAHASESESSSKSILREIQSLIVRVHPVFPRRAS